MRILLSLLLFMCLSLTSLADVITQDPNTLGNQQEAEAAQPTDPRLAQKINCTPGYTRLHTVVEELSKLSEVTIRCGKNNDDWHVRDIPVVVWVKDLPLGKVLETLAAATHTQLTSNRMDDIITYRISRSSKLEKQIADYEQAKHKAIIDGFKWDWDTTAKLKDLPDGAYAPGGTQEERDMFPLVCTPGNLAYTRAAGSVLALLGPELREQAMVPGSILKVDWDNASPSLRSALLELGRAALGYDGGVLSRWGDVGTDISNVPRTDVDSVALSISCHINEANDTRWGVSIKVHGNTIGDRWFGSDLSRDTSRLAHYASGIDVGTRPVLPDPPVVILPAGYFELAKTDNDSDPALLNETVTLAAPAGYERSPLPTDPIAKFVAPTTVKDPASSDALVELAKTAGLSIISEDFQSHLSVVKSALLFGKERSIGDSLRTFNNLSSNAKGVSYGERNWFVDEKNGLVLGRSVDWVRQHRNLVPEKLIANLVTKANGSGVMFDDVLPVVSLTEGQRNEWILRSRELKSLNNTLASLCAPGFDKLWTLYLQLSDDHRKMLASTEGLPFSIIDPAVAIPVINEVRKKGGNISVGSVPDNITADLGETEQVSPEELGYYSWRLRRSEYDGSPLPTDVSNVYTVSNGPYSMKMSFSSGEVLDKSLADWHFWDVTYSYDRGDTHRRWSTSIGPFPIFSPKRLAELQEQAKKAQPK